uniref:Uncharacterized protein n=1 Tax=Oryza barthii TaxID=65489 RepID=A0A0D3H4H5_9ORYZ
MEEDDNTMAVDGVEATDCFGPHYRTLGSTLTSKEVFNWANSNNQRLLHVGDIDRTSKSYIFTSCSMWLATEDRVESAGDEGMTSYDVEAFMRVNLLLLNEQIWEAVSK